MNYPLRLILVAWVILVSNVSFAQSYLLNEDFSTATNITPPANWQNTTLAGQETSKWRFDNPGNQLVNFPVTSPFAILDAAYVSPDTAVEIVVLETPVFDASQGLFFLLFFDHYFFPDSAATAQVLAFDGTDWIEVYTLDTATLDNPSSEVVDLTDAITGVTNAQLRFVWTGHGKGFWAIDNVSVYSALYTDAGISEIDNPVMPFNAGLQDVKVTLRNYGYDTLSSATIKWSINDVMQSNYNWTGAISYGSSIANINLGSFDFQSSGVYHIKIWSEMPNGLQDPNNHNDSIIEFLNPALCGVYTIGGSNPDFQNFSDAILTVSAAGVSCSVVFQVRDGTYTEQFEIDSIPGASSINTVTFESESGDSSLVIITSNYDISTQPHTILLNNSKHLRFNNLSMSKVGTYWDYFAMIIAGNSYDIEINNCHVNPSLATGIYIKDNADSITIQNSYLTGSLSAIYNGKLDGIRLSTTGSISIFDNIISSFQTSGIYGSAGKLFIERNTLEKLSIVVRDFGKALTCNVSDTCSIVNNTITETPDGMSCGGTGKYFINGNIINFSSGMGIAAYLSNSTISNNWIYNLFNDEPTTNAGVFLSSCSNIKLVFNSIHLIKSGVDSKLLHVNGGDNIIVKNNIFSIEQEGFPFSITGTPSNLSADYNGYYSPYSNIGKLNELPYSSLTAWATAIGGESQGVFAKPFFTNDSTLQTNQILLNNAGLTISGILYDIDSTLRDPATPDIGAVEFSPCNIDAGINFVTAPSNPITPSVEDVKVILQNQGTDELNSTSVNWSVNGVIQTPYVWTGSLTSEQNTELTIGTYSFQPAISYLIKAWTSNPNSNIDCNSNNDTTSSLQLYTKLCDTLTIGGTNPNFQTFGQAVEFLNRAGVLCPVVFQVRDGTYTEQFEIDSIPGASSINTVTFESESGDSSLVIITSNHDISTQSHTILLNDTKHVRFKNITVSKVGTYWDYFAMIIAGNSYDIEINNCHVNPSLATGIYIKDNADSITIQNSYLTGSLSAIYNGKLDGIRLSTTGSISIFDNIISSFQTSGIYGSAGKLFIERNTLEKLSIVVRDFGKALTCNVSDTCSIVNNTITETPDGMSCGGTGKYFINGNIINFSSGIGIAAYLSNSTISNNWIYNLFNDEPTTNAGVFLSSCSNIKLVFNSIHLIKSGVDSKLLHVNGGDNIIVKNNIFSIEQEGFPFSITGTPSNLSADYNGYYSPYSNIGKLNELPYSSLTAWATAIGGESQGVFAKPFFTNDSTLQTNQILLNNAGLTISGILYDIDSTLRDPATPDIGAVEFSPCNIDAGINFVTAPSNPITPSVEDVKVILQNQGTDELNSTSVNWSVNGVIQTPYVWTGSLTSEQNTELTIGTYSFQPAISYLIKAWTSNPNSNIDCNLNNDTTSSLQLYTKLCDTLTIGGTNPNFQTFGQAVEFLNRAGVLCPVVFQVRDGTYTEQFEIDSIPGASSINTVTFESESGDNSLVIITSNHDISTQPHTILLNDTKHVRFKNITVSKVGTYWDYFAMIIAGNSYDIEINNCQFTPSLATGIYIKDNSDSITIQNSYLTGSLSALYIATLDGIRLNTTGSVSVFDNIISSFQTSGITGSAGKLFIERNNLDKLSIIVGSFGPAISSNVSDTCSIINNIITESLNGISCQGQAKYLIDGNFISSGIETGLFASIHNSTIVNNMITNYDETTVAGISLSSCQNIGLHYNTVKTKGNDLSSSNLKLSDCIDVSIKNNIFSNISGGYCIDIAQISSNVIWDYNDYYNPNNKIGKILGTNYPTFFSWSAAIAGEANGFNLNPYFINPSSYKIYQTGLNGAGIPITGVTDDIENELRDALAPDIGCDEFEFPSHLFGIVFHDVNQNGIQDDNELGLPGQLIAIEPGHVIAMTDSTGMWTDDYIPAGTYTASIYVPDNWAVSTAPSHVFFFNDTTETIRVPSFGLYSTSPCPSPEVTINAPELVRCLSGQLIYVTAKNNIMGTAAILGAYVEVGLDTLISLDAASLAYTSLGDNRYRFDLGDLNPGEEVDFTLSTTLSCDAFNGQTLCVQANIYPVDSCAIDTSYNQAPGVTPCSLPWDKSSLEVNGWCAGDSVHFSITNTGDPGNGNMVCYSPVRVYLDGVLYDFDSIQLAGGQIVYYDYEGYGQTWRLEADQHPLHPGNSHPNASVEACGDTTNWTPGLINLLPHDDADPYVDIYCGMVTGEWLAAEKTGYPLGLEDPKYIIPGQGIQYMIHFKNTGSDTARQVVIRDTLDLNLNIFTLETGTSSHPYTFTMYGPRVLEWRFDNINLPPESINDLGSQGFLTFRTEQNPNLPNGTQIFNRADVYYNYADTTSSPQGAPPTDGDEISNTNQTLHTIYDQIQNPVPEAAGVISGPIWVCQGETGIEYTVPEIYGASAYVWTLPEGVTGSSSINSILVEFDFTAQSGNIAVHGTNANGNGVPSFLFVNINPGAVPGEVTGGTHISFGASTDTLVLRGSQGTVVIWQRSFNSDPYTDLTATQGLLSYLEVPPAAGTWKYRAVLQSDSCNTENSLPATVEVIDGPITRNWTGVIDEKWHVAGNWSPPGVPGPSDVVYISAGVPNMPEVKVQGMGCKDLILMPGAILYITNNVTFSIYD